MRILKDTDWLMFGSAILISLAGLVSMYSFGGTSVLAGHQLIWLSIGIAVFFIFSALVVHFLRRTGMVGAIYELALVFLLLLVVVGWGFSGARG